MRITTGWAMVGCMTATALLYTHQQTALVQQSYGLHEQLTQRNRIYERYVFLGYDVMTRTAPNRLRMQLALHDIELAVPETTRTVEASSVTPMASWMTDAQKGQAGWERTFSVHDVRIYRE
jgi:hypothetical protein